MARPHIMFVQTQMIPWSKNFYGNARTDVEFKMLSQDDNDGSSTCIMRYSPGWSRLTPEHLLTHEEFFVLDGAIEINDRLYEKHCYGFLPAGYIRDRTVSYDGAVLLTMFYGVPTLGLVATTTTFDPKLLVEYVNPLAMEWDPGLVDPQLSRGVAIKPLRTNPYTGETSFLYSSPPHRTPPGMAKPQWTHPMVEELYTIEGDYVWGDLGRMQRGGYCWWREDIYHGPAGTDTGYNLFVRTINGPLVNTFDTVKKPFSWNPTHQPILPPELAPYGQPLPPTPNY